MNQPGENDLTPDPKMTPGIKPLCLQELSELDLVSRQVLIKIVAVLKSA
jgi:hypothetical protein